MDKNLVKRDCLCSLKHYLAFLYIIRDVSTSETRKAALELYGR